MSLPSPRGMQPSRASCRRRAFRYQGEAPLDDEDFLRLAGDKDGAAEIASKRETGITLNRMGLAALGIGAGLMVGGYIARPKADPDVGSSSLSTALITGGIIGGIIGLAGGGSLAWLGAAKTNAEHPLDDAARFNEAANGKLRGAFRASTPATR